VFPLAGNNGPAFPETQWQTVVYGLPSSHFSQMTLLITMAITIKIILTILLITILAVYTYRLIKSKVIRKRLIIMMEEIAEIRNLKIDEYQLLHEQILGIDRQNGILIYLNYSHRINSRIVDLREVMDCSLILKKVVVQLELTYKQPSRPPLSVCFFRKYAESSFRRNARIKTANYWKDLISTSPDFASHASVAKKLDNQIVG
jgi:hypothetical protein